jgi:hypothetical protein
MGGLKDQPDILGNHQSTGLMERASIKQHHIETVGERQGKFIEKHLKAGGIEIREFQIKIP